LDLNVAPHETRLDVINGTVELIRDADGVAVQTESGFGAIVARGTDFRAKPLLPSDWASRDIGSVAVAGNARSENGVFVIRGSGEDIWEDADAFHYAFQELDGDGEIVARVTEFENTGRDAKAGLMIRETLEPGSKHATFTFKPNNTIWFHSRLHANGLSQVEGHTAQRRFRMPPPCWLKLVRRGDLFIAYYSKDGEQWETTETGETHVTGRATISMKRKVYIGLAVASFNNGVLNTSSFDQVKVIRPSGNPAPTTLPTASLQKAQ
jgi:hypothetical protein